MADNQTNTLLKTRSEIAEMLGISLSTLYRRCRENDINLSRKKYLTLEEQEAILALFNLRVEEVGLNQ